MGRTAQTISILLIAAFLTGVSVCGGESKKNAAELVSVTLNGLEIGIDAETGGVLTLSYPGPGKMLDAASGSAGIVDVAYPIKKF